MKNEVKTWEVTYAYKDGRSGTVGVTTEIMESEAFKYGNGKAGSIQVGHDDKMIFDLRYCRGDLHELMIYDYFCEGIVKIEEV